MKKYVIMHKMFIIFIFCQCHSYRLHSSANLTSNRSVWKDNPTIKMEPKKPQELLKKNSSHQQKLLITTKSKSN